MTYLSYILYKLFFKCLLSQVCSLSEQLAKSCARRASSTFVDRRKFLGGGAENVLKIVWGVSILWLIFSTKFLKFIWISVFISLDGKNTSLGEWVKLGFMGWLKPPTSPYAHVGSLCTARRCLANKKVWTGLKTLLLQCDALTSFAVHWVAVAQRSMISIES